LGEVIAAGMFANEVKHLRESAETAFVTRTDVLD
jgi:hypothetical protein